MSAKEPVWCQKQLCTVETRFKAGPQWDRNKNTSNLQLCHNQLLMKPFLFYSSKVHSENTCCSKGRNILPYSVSVCPFPYHSAGQKNSLYINLCLYIYHKYFCHNMEIPKWLNGSQQIRKLLVSSIFEFNFMKMLQLLTMEIALHVSVYQTLCINHFLYLGAT